MEINQNFLAKLDSLINCDPSRCKKAGCPLFYQEQNKCDAERFISLFTAVMEEKLEQVDKYTT